MTSGKTTQRAGLGTQELSDVPFEVVCHDTSAIERDEWLELRRTGLGGSDIAAAMGLSPFTSKYALWLDKKGESVPFEQSEYMKWGTRLEDSIAKAFEDETGIPIVDEKTMIRSKTFPLALANVDRATADDTAIVECKNVGKHKAHEWVDGPPLHYRLQGQWYMFVRGNQRMYFAVLIGGQDFRIFLVERDDDLIAKMIADAEAFWTLVTLDRAPEIDESDSTAEALKAQYNVIERPSVEGGARLAALVERRNGAKWVLDAAEEQLQGIDNEIIALVGDAAEGTVDGVAVVRRPSQSRTSIDITALKRDYPQLATEYAKTTTFRKFQFPKAKEAK